VKIEGLKEAISSNDVRKFKFGDADANKDKLLNLQCFCSIRGIDDILLGNKAYVLGVKGTGKTAIFKLIKDNILNLTINDNCPYKIYSFDDNIQFDFIKRFVAENIKIRGNINTSTKYQLIWELYIIYNILYDIKEGLYKNNIPKKLKEYIKIFERAFNFSQGIHLIDIIQNIKIKLSVTYEQMTQILTPTASIEKNESSNRDGDNQNTKEFLEINIKDIKTEISNYLAINGRSIAILFDRLDDFVTKSNFKIQRDVISALVRVERDYTNYSNIHLLIFLRNDLFNRIDFTDIGYDKVITSVTELRWHSENIREFLSKRLLTNYDSILNIESLIFTDEDQEQAKKKRETFFSNIFKLINKKVKRNKRLAISDEVAITIINSFFEKEIIHYNEAGETEKILFVDFLKTHFCLANDFTNPRIILIFLELLMEEVREHINNNYIDEYKLVENSYNVITDEIIIKVYDELQQLINKIFLKIDSRFEEMFEILITRKSYKKHITAKEIYDYLRKFKNDDVKEFIIFLEQVLFFKNTTRKNTPIPSRKYEIPILFQQVRKII
jgi:hypothetical protein